MNLILHKSASSSFRMVGETGLMLVRYRSGWEIKKTSVFDESWAERNRELLGRSFATLREARETLEAHLAVDPPKTPATADSALSELTRIGPGYYRGTLFGKEIHVHREGCRWRILDSVELGQPVSHKRFGSLWHLRAHFSEPRTG